MATSYYTSNDLIAAVKRKIMFPIAQNTFSETDILAFANEEMMISQVPSVLSFHEEYYVMALYVPLVENVNRYEIPSRAIGMKLRDVFWADQNNNLFEMTRVSSEDKAYFQRNVGANQAVHKFYVENNYVILTPSQVGSPTGSLVFYFFIRPNQLVANDRAATITAFCNRLTVDNTSISPGDTVSIGGETFTAVAGAPGTNEFQIGGTSTVTATNLVAALNTNGIVTATNGTPSTPNVEAESNTITYSFTTSNSLGFSINPNQCVIVDQIPTHFENGMLVDFLQTSSGHRIKDYDIEIPTGGISTDSIEFPAGTFPDDLVVGDYICSAHECIIPFLPDDLHTGLAERTCARILAAMGDQQGMAAIMAKVGEIEQRQGTLLDNRIEGSCKKINARHSILRFQKMGVTRRR